jgi:hypothetical protein
MDKNDKFEKWWDEYSYWAELKQDGPMKCFVKDAYMQGRKDGKGELDGSGTGR